jgi:zinc transporter
MKDTPLPSDSNQIDPASSPDGLLHALVLDGRGGRRMIDWAGVEDWNPDDGLLWVHLDLDSAVAQSWLREDSGLDSMISGALLAEGTRPRVQPHGAGFMAFLRGVNLNPGMAPDDMISVRIWIEPTRVISLRSPRLLAIDDVRERLASGRGPKDAASVFIAVASRLTERMWPVVSNLDELIDELEETVVEEPTRDLRRELSQMRRQAISLRRFIGPQRDALATLQNVSLDWINERQRSTLRETIDRVTRIVEDLDAMRERAAVVQEELAGRLSEQMNRTMYILSIVTGVFLPLGLLTGLFGINIGGMPGIENPWAFSIFSFVLVVIASFNVWLFRRLRIL